MARPRAANGSSLSNEAIPPKLLMFVSVFSSNISPKRLSCQSLKYTLANLALALPSRQWVGKYTDLKSAYRHVPILDSGLQHSYIAYHCPKSKSACVRQRYVLPLGH